MDALFRCRIIEELDDAARYITDDDARYEKHHLTAQQLAQKHQQSHYGKGSYHGSSHDKQMSSDSQAADGGSSAEKQENDSHAEICACINTEDGRTCQRVAESRLQEQATCAQSCSRKESRQHLRHASLQHDYAPGRMPLNLLSTKDLPNILHGNVERTPQHIRDGKQDESKSQELKFVFHSFSGLK